MPVMFPGVLGIGSTLTAMQVLALVSQALLAFTHTSPEIFPKVALIEVVPLPEVIVVPAGTDHT